METKSFEDFQNFPSSFGICKVTLMNTLIPNPRVLKVKIQPLYYYNNNG